MTYSITIALAIDTGFNSERTSLDDIVSKCPLNYAAALNFISLVGVAQGLGFRLRQNLLKVSEIAQCAVPQVWQDRCADFTASLFEICDVVCDVLRTFIEPQGTAMVRITPPLHDLKRIDSTSVRIRPYQGALELF
jgi:hypothetical protein